MKEINIAIVAHDGRKKELMGWVEYNWKLLSQYNIYATGTTGRLIEELVVKDGKHLLKPYEGKVKRLLSGPLGGDQQIGAKIVEGNIDFMIFLWDPLEAQPHDPDVKALLRIAVLYDIPVANNLATADFMLNSRYMDEPYSRRVENFNKTIQDRVEKMK